MIQINQRLQEVKEEFFSICRENQIPTQNRAVLLYGLSQRLEEDSKNRLFRQMILLALADNGVLLNYFEKFQEGEEEAAFESVKENYSRLTLDDSLQRELSLKWKKILASIMKSPKNDVHCNVNEIAYEEETKQAVRLYQKLMEVSGKDSPELYNNLHYFICMAEQVQELRMIMPLFLFQLMIRHTCRLAVKENLDVSFKSLWSYKEYQTEQDNGKNYKRYQLYTRLFAKLCKAYRGHDGVDLPLCQYGFWKTSNLAGWIMETKPKKAKKALTPFYCDLLRADMSPIAYYEPDNDSPNGIFGVADKEELRYMETSWDYYQEVEQAVREFVFDHIDYVIHWMKYLYVDCGVLREYVEEIYRECIPKLPEKKAWMEKCVRAHIYEIVRDILELAVRTKVITVLTQEAKEEGK